MKKLLMAVVVAGAAALATPAHAHPNYHYAGGCGFLTLSDGSDNQQTQWNGEIHVAVVATDSTAGAPTAATISVECVVYTNGTNPTVALSASGFVAAANAKDFTFYGPSTDVVTVCENVTVTGPLGTEFHSDCDDATTTPLIPQPVQDILDQQVWPTVDGAVCPALGSLTPGVTGVADITPQGDVWVGGQMIFDCPPYGS